MLHIRAERASCIVTNMRVQARQRVAENREDRGYEPPFRGRRPP
jgi:hypothetical protein